MIDSRNIQSVHVNSLSELISEHLTDKIYTCKYYDIEDFQKKIKNSSYSFATLSLNIRSFCGKLNEFKNLIDDLSCENFKFDVICLQELWGIPKDLNTNISDYHPLIHRLRKFNGKNNIGGGVGIFVNNSLEYEPIESLSIFEEKKFESLFIKISIGKGKYKIIGNIYRAPGTDINAFIHNLNDIFSLIEKDKSLNKAEEIQIMGDFNINLIKHGSHKQTSSFLDYFLSKNMLPIISLPTRLTPSSSTLIDNIFTNCSNNASCDSGLIYSALSDHLPIFNLTQNNIEQRNRPKLTRYERNFSKKNKMRFKTLLNESDWVKLFHEDDPKRAFDLFENTIDSCFEQSFPITEKQITKSNHPKEAWMTSAILESRKTKNKLASRKIKHPSKENIDKYKNYDKCYKSVIRKAKTKHYKDMFSEYSKCMRKTWSKINEILNMKKSSFEIPDIFNENGTVYTGKQEISEGFNDYFATIGSNLAAKIPPSNVSFESFLGRPINENFIFANVTEESVLNTLNLLKSKNSSGHDKISVKLLKEIMPVILIPVVYIFNLSLRTGYVPDSYKCARIVPIFKSGNQAEFTNYRPISLLSSFSKLLEKIIARQMYRYLNKHDILYKYQFGFRSNHDTNQPVIHLMDKIYEGLNKDMPEYTLGIFLDLKKAFDTVNHDILLEKLKHYGLRNTSNLWFKNYLINRTQFVTVHGNNSSIRTTNCGVPQGSVLGPLLFLLYINDLPNATSFFTSLFADDTALALSSSDLNVLFRVANRELSKAAEWFGTNKLTLNVSKTKYIVFRKKQMKIFPDIHKLQIGNENIERIGLGCEDEYFKFVGMKLDEFLTWEHHIKHVENKVSSASFALSRIKNFLPANIKKLIYNSLIKSQIEYGLIVYGGIEKHRLNRIRNLQKRAVRFVAAKSKLSHTSPIFGNLELLNLEDLYTLNAGTFMHKYMNSKLPTSFLGMFKVFSGPNRNRNFILEQTKQKVLDYFPKVALQRVWNNLSIELKTSSSISSFKAKFKNERISSYNTYRCQDNNCYSCSI